MKHRAISFFFILFITCAACRAGAGEVSPEQLTIWPEGQGYQMLWQYMHALAAELPKRDFPPATTDEWDARKPLVRQDIMEVLGIHGLEKTPLNARVVDIIDRPDFTIEKLIWEGRPGFYTLANLWKPKGVEGKLPVLFWIPGHSATGKAAYGWPQNIFVRKGIMVLAIDWVGYSERSPQNHDKNAVCWTVGTSTRGIEIWDDIRAVDYLLSRDDVDPDRLAIAGRSGGGSQTFLLIGVEPRARAYVPQAGFSTFQEAYIQKAGGHCICNYMLGALARFNAADVLSMGAPDKLIQVVNGRLDRLFPIDGASQSVSDARKVYNLYGNKNRLRFFSDGGEHPATERQIQEITKFLMRALTPENEDYSIPEYEHLTPEELAVGLPQDSLTSIDICRRMKDAITYDPPPTDLATWEARAADMRDRLENQILGGFPERGPLNVEIHEEIKVDGATIQKISIETEPGLRLPLNVYIPDKGPEKKWVQIGLHKEGKVSELVNGIGNAPLKSYIKEDIFVVPDLRGLGEMSPEPEGELKFMRNYLEYELTTSAGIMGRPLAGMRAYDITRVIDYLCTRDDVDQRHIIVNALTPMSHVALLAAALDSRIESTGISFIPNTFFVPTLPKTISMSFYVPGILKVGDLPQIAALIAPRELAILDGLNSDMRRIPINEMQDSFKFTSSVYALYGLEKHLHILQLRPFKQGDTVIEPYPDDQ